MNGRETVDVPPCPVCENETAYRDEDGKIRCDNCDEVLPH